MALTDSGAGRVILSGLLGIKVTLAQDVIAGDVIGYSSGWKKATASTPIVPRAIAATSGRTGEEITAYGIAVVDGYTGGTADALVYLSDTAGCISESSGTNKYIIGTVVNSTTVRLFPGIQGQIDTADIADSAVTTAKIADTAVTLAKLTGLTSASIIVGNSSNRPAEVAVSGDVSLSNTGVVTAQPQALWDALRYSSSDKVRILVPVGLNLTTNGETASGDASGFGYHLYTGTGVDDVAAGSNWIPRGQLHTTGLQGIDFSKKIDLMFAVQVPMQATLTERFKLLGYWSGINPWDDIDATGWGLSIVWYEDSGSLKVKLRACSSGGTAQESSAYTIGTSSNFSCYHLAHDPAVGATLYVGTNYSSLTTACTLATSSDYPTAESTDGRVQWSVYRVTSSSNVYSQIAVPMYARVRS